MKSLAVVGGSLAAVSTARALRNQGFEGRITVLSQEDGAPYDRPPLSKGFLTGEVDVTDIGLLDDPDELALDWRGGVCATALRPAARSVELSDGGSVVVDGVVVATGARPRLPWPAMAGVHVVRTLDDATALRAELLPGHRLVVVGAGWLGAEVASSAQALGLDVTVVEASTAPLSASLGRQVGAAVAGVHERSGVRLHTGVGVVGFTGGHRVEGVLLDDDHVVPADVVVVAVGVVPNIDWLSGSGLALEHGVRCDAYGSTSVPNVVAVGDCAAWHDDVLGRPARLEHWTAARERAGIAAATLLSGGTSRGTGRPAYVWSDQYGVRLQVVGHPHAADSMSVDEGSLDELDFVAVYKRGDVVVAAVAAGRASSFMRWRKHLAARSRSGASSTVPAAASG